MELDDQVALLMQGTEYGDQAIKARMTQELRQRLAEGRPLRVYCGYDPTSTDLHLGHTISMRKLRQFQDLGHDVTFLIGSYTALVGDPSDKNKARPVLTPEQVAENAQTYAEQAYRILDREKTKVRYNGEWLSKLTLLDLIRLGQNFTIQQFLARENFSKRVEAGEPVFLHETFYALMQGYDAVAMETDVQVGGTEQLFNIIVAGRKLQEALGQRPQVGITTGILPGTDGVLRMSKSTGNVIPIDTTPADMYGKIMSLPDSAMVKYFQLLSRYSPAQVAAVEQALADNSRHPRDIKMELAREIVAIYYGEEQVADAEASFKSVFQRGDLPADIPEVTYAGTPSLVDFLVSNQLATSKTDARRLISQNGVRIDGTTISDANARLDTPSSVIQVGKRKFIKAVRA
jgi:tyrosyl-tRNA synthetase